MIRIPVWPGVRITIGGAPNPHAVRVTLALGKRARVVRLVSKRGWMLLLVSYDWRKPADPTPGADRV